MLDTFTWHFCKIATWLVAFTNTIRNPLNVFVFNMSHLYRKAEIGRQSGNVLPVYLFLPLSIYGPPAEKMDLMTNSENLKIMYILKILSVWSNS